MSLEPTVNAELFQSSKFIIMHGPIGYSRGGDYLTERNGPERTGTDRNSRLFHGTEQTNHARAVALAGNISSARVSKTPLGISEVVSLLQDPPLDKISTLPPVQPKGGEI